MNLPIATVKAREVFVSGKRLTQRVDHCKFPLQ
jgi:hypothetical protein